MALGQPLKEQNLIIQSQRNDQSVTPFPNAGGRSMCVIPTARSTLFPLPPLSWIVLYKGKMDQMYFPHESLDDI